MEKEKAIINVFEENKRVYGVEKLKKCLDRTKLRVSRRKIREIQAKLGLFPVYMHHFKYRYESGKDIRRENLLEGNFYTVSPEEKWIADTKCPKRREEV
ncbi:MAG: IS3 family transposase [Brevinema sp.]